MDPNVVGDVKGGGVDPQWPTEPEPGPVQQLPEPGDQVQSRLDVLADHVDPDVTSPVEQAGAVQNGESTDGGAPAVVVPQQQEQVRGGHPVQARVWAITSHSLPGHA